MDLGTGAGDGPRPSRRLTAWLKDAGLGFKRRAKTKWCGNADRTFHHIHHDQRQCMHALTLVSELGCWFLVIYTAPFFKLSISRLIGIAPWVVKCLYQVGTVLR